MTLHDPRDSDYVPYNPDGFKPILEPEEPPYFMGVERMDSLHVPKDDKPIESLMSLHEEAHPEPEASLETALEIGRLLNGMIQADIEERMRILNARAAFMFAMPYAFDPVGDLMARMGVTSYVQAAQDDMKRIRGDKS